MKEVKEAEKAEREGGGVFVKKKGKGSKMMKKDEQGEQSGNVKKRERRKG